MRINAGTSEEMNIPVARIVIILMLVGGLLWGVSFACSMVNDAASVTREEVGPKALRDKYEWFKTAYAQLDRKRADLNVLRDQLSSTMEMYEGTPMKDWPQDERSQYRQKEAELRGLVASYNNLAADYNSAMAQWYTRFVNSGDLPKGALQQTPREVAPYMYN